MRVWMNDIGRLQWFARRYAVRFRAVMPCFITLLIAGFAPGEAVALPLHPCVSADNCPQSPPPPAIAVKADNLLRRDGDDFHIEDISGETGTAAPVRLQLPPFRPTDYLLLSFRGLPKDFALSSGFRTSDAWLVSAHEAKDLLIMPPEDFDGSFTMEVRLIRGQNVVARTQVVKITFARPEIPATTVSETPPLAEERPTAALTEAAAVTTTFQHEQEPDAEVEAEAEAEPAADAESQASEPPPVGSEQEAYLLGLAQKMLDQNDIAAARGIYRRLAYHKSRRGTLRLAQSYDPAFLSQFRTSNSLEDLEEARRWYRQAADLGADEASQRLSALDAHFN
jgi:hypothetical protein